MTPDKWDEIKPTGYCLACGAFLLPGLRWCGPACASEWAGLGAAYARLEGDAVSVEETDTSGTKIRAWFTKYF